MRWEWVVAGIAVVIVLTLVLAGCGSLSTPVDGKNAKRVVEPGFSVSPDGKMAAIIANDQNLYLLDLEKGTPIQVTQKQEVRRRPIFLADGSRMLYVTEDEPGRVQLAIAGKDGTRIKTLDFRSTIGGLEVSPDGKLAAYSAHAKEFSHIALLNLETGKLDALTPPGQAGDVAPRFSPDGSRILFIRGTQHTERNMVAGAGWHHNELFSIGVDGSGLKQVSQADFTDNHFFPIFADNGRCVLFSVYETSDPAVKDSKMSTLLFSIASDGSEKLPKRVEVAGTPTPYPGADKCSILSTSADGSKILFMSDRAESYAYNYWTMSPDGSAPVQLSFDTVKDIQAKRHGHMRDPVISADGKRVYFYDRYTDSLMQIDADGKNARAVGTPGAFADPMKWTNSK